jgi:hypothetical protein
MLKFGYVEMNAFCFYMLAVEVDEGWYWYKLYVEFECSRRLEYQLLELPNPDPNEQPLTGSDLAVTIPDPLVRCHADQRASTPPIGMTGGRSTSSAHNFT